MTNNIKWLQVENTTKCNAWCPACARNQGGYELAPGLVVEDLATEKFQTILEMFPNLETIQFCGTHGDFAAAGNVWEHVFLAKHYAKKIQIHTHGGIRNERWWKDLGKTLKDTDHDVWFAIDGLKGVHESYRQGTDFDKTIANAQAFIGAGGHATWQFIPWEHNEHQLKDCLKLSQDLGFKNFKLVKSVRKGFTGKHWRTGEPIEFKPWSKDKEYNQWEITPVRNQVLKTDCQHLTQPSVYLNANGQLSNCCHINLARSVDNFNDLPNIAQELESQPHGLCLKFCGSYVKLDKHDTD